MSSDSFIVYGVILLRDRAHRMHRILKRNRLPMVEIKHAPIRCLSDRKNAVFQNIITLPSRSENCGRLYMRSTRWTQVHQSLCLLERFCRLCRIPNRQASGGAAWEWRAEEPAPPPLAQTRRPTWYPWTWKKRSTRSTTKPCCRKVYLRYRRFHRKTYAAWSSTRLGTGSSFYITDIRKSTDHQSTPDTRMTPQIRRKLEFFDDQFKQNNRSITPEPDRKISVLAIEWSRGNDSRQQADLRRAPRWS